MIYCAKHPWFVYLKHHKISVRPPSGSSRPVSGVRPPSNPRQACIRLPPGPVRPALGPIRSPSGLRQASARPPSGECSSGGLELAPVGFCTSLRGFASLSAANAPLPSSQPHY
ncbi:hypothetical protein PoB_003369700 [Plakobranchus ocellatus]|uniref:Uncharacterized protein n=1 Tax=Plakobranchus ocellatus TaxID=259542 RepID=A0AAV4AIV2_9GAST|nr:hypothetical protein PoB_003369700 [Plakobranchus ocellatus]